MKSSKKRKLNNILNIYIGLGVALWIVAAVLILTPVVPAVAYRLFPQATDNEVSALTGQLEEDKNRLEEIREKHVDETRDPPAIRPLPPYDPTLPKENRIIISKIGVDAEIQESDDSTAALNEGPWRVYNFGLPNYQETPFFPVIIASHRWGAVGWNAEQRKTMSFYSLPDTQVGDKIEIIWNQRRYEYEIYAAGETTQIEDYSGDLILYTCKLIWDSPIRIFRYAHRTN
ncbi:MAG: hypothetical protein QY318_00870 [Candidatus Dojkabacteria bacterium]|nr:MAG: hypothetical protein QY318_00870 [Candidatus Dojkabacteria bacterium]